MGGDILKPKASFLPITFVHSPKTNTHHKVLFVHTGGRGINTDTSKTLPAPSHPTPFSSVPLCSPLFPSVPLCSPAAPSHSTSSSASVFTPNFFLSAASSFASLSASIFCRIRVAW